MFGIGIPELIIILVIALVVFGPGKLPSVGSSIGKAINEFKKASKDVIGSDTEEVKPKKEIASSNGEENKDEIQKDNK